LLQAQSFTSTEKQTSNVKETNVALDTPNLQAGTSPGPNPYPNLAQDDPAHPGWMRSGVDDTPGHKAYYIHFEAKPGKGGAVEQFLRDILAGVEQEPGTGPWFGCRFSETTFGIFEAFPDSAARDAHDIGPGGRNFLRSELLHEMLAYPAHLYRLDVMFGKENHFGVNASILETRGGRSSHGVEAKDPISLRDE
jgi:quinol monooxygenase YgiN